MTDAAAAAPEGMSYTTRLRWRAAGRVAAFTAVLAALFGAVVWQQTGPAVEGTAPLWSLEGGQPLAFADGGDTLLCNFGQFPAVSVTAFDADDGTQGRTLVTGFRTVVAPLADGTVAASLPQMGQTAGGIELIRTDGSSTKVTLPVTAAEFIATLPAEEQADAKASLLGTAPLATPIAIEEEAGGVRVRASVLSYGTTVNGVVLLEADVDPATGAVSNRALTFSKDPNAAMLGGMNYVAGTATDLADFGVASGEIPPVNTATLRSHDAGQFIAAVWTESDTEHPKTLARIWAREGGRAVLRREIVLPIRKTLFSSESPTGIVLSPDGTRLAIGTVGGPGGQTVYVFDVSED